ncbi:Mut7-C RNAse domain-containing protein [Acidianus sp. RZ1]|uniref:Mut7-C RNAse domain-containing protein n=1 Tax=Acidianus sp. RZ1 TaxID=1540082 RepID=UPI0014919058|nr:Mut7-C RNAse domain-containing protein [Acidianus sp. RZ1]NON63380.1 hypothetical protein [Acidianus sp. RZ1]
MQKFILDAMMGRLARWLRILGYDTLYNNSYEYWKIIKIAQNEKRIIVTRDRGLCARALKIGIECFLALPADSVIITLAKLSIKYDIDLSVNLDASRCSVCNGILRKVEKNKWLCTSCNKEYWKGKHWSTIPEILIKAQKEREKMYEQYKHPRTRSREGEDSSQISKKSDREEIKTIK